MVMAENSKDVDGLEAFFAAGRAQAPATVPDALMARILADATGVQAATAQAAARPVARPATAGRPGLWRRLSETLGGRGALAGLLSATLAGLWLGFSPPDQIAPLTRTVSQTVLGDNAATMLDGLDLIPAIDTVLTQG